MSAEVITGKFRNQNSVAAAYSLPASATIGLPILDQALGRGALEVGDLERCFRGLIDEILRGAVDLKSHFQSVGARPFQRRGG